MTITAPARWFTLLGFVLAVGSLVLPHCALADEPAKFIIRPKPDAPWGGAIEDVEKVLHSTAEALWPYFPDRKLPAIEVEPKGGPIVHYERGPEGEIRVHLATGDRLWAQHAYQFAHEFCHILCKFESCEQRHQWFEESLCELASLFALRRMAEEWKTNPPYSNWRDYAAALNAYAQDRIDGAKLPEGQTLAEWYRANAEHLAANPTARERNTIVAVALLPLFEKHPKFWRAVEHLNDQGVKNAGTFAEFLSRWRNSIDKADRPLVKSIARSLGVKLPKQ